MAIIEALLAVKFATDAKLDSQVTIIVIIIVIPFAFISELIVDHPDFWKSIFSFGKKNKKASNFLRQVSYFLGFWHFFKCSLRRCFLICQPQLGQTWQQGGIQLAGI